MRVEPLTLSQVLWKLKGGRGYQRRWDPSSPWACSWDVNLQGGISAIWVVGHERKGADGGSSVAWMRAPGLVWGAVGAELCFEKWLGSTEWLGVGNHFRSSNSMEIGCSGHNGRTKIGRRDCYMEGCSWQYNKIGEKKKERKKQWEGFWW